MTAAKLEINFDAKAVENMQPLLLAIGEKTPSDLVSRAIGLLAAVTPYVQDGVLTVIDPKQTGENGKIDLVFENARATKV